jgi:hypothetical protein
MVTPISPEIVERLAKQLGIVCASLKVGRERQGANPSLGDSTSAFVVSRPITFNMYDRFPPKLRRSWSQSAMSA